MSKKRKIKNEKNLLLEFFSNGNLSVEFNDITDMEKVCSLLTDNRITFCQGELPKMKDGRVVACSKLITVTDKEKLYDVLRLKDGGNENAE